MKDSTDHRTIDFLNPPRGRPRTGCVPAAVRQARSRQRRLEVLASTRDPSGLSDPQLIDALRLTLAGVNLPCSPQKLVQEFMFRASLLP